MTEPYVLAVASGKGGVGKSTVAVNLAVALAIEGRRVGLVDADVYGPNVPLMLGLTRREPARSISLARTTPLSRQPVERFGIKVMSSQFLIGEDQPVAFDGILVNLLVQGLLVETDWGDADLLIVDLPPGTADLQQSLARSFGLHAVVLVVTPQDVAHLDGRKVLAMFRACGVKVHGAVENMAGLECPHCGERVDVFPRVAEERSLWNARVDRLASLPLLPAVADSAEAGVPEVLAHPDGRFAAEFRQLVQKLASVS